MQSGLEAKRERLHEGRGQNREKIKYSTLEAHEPGDQEEGRKIWEIKGEGKEAGKGRSVLAVTAPRVIQGMKIVLRKKIWTT